MAPPLRGLFFYIRDYLKKHNIPFTANGGGSIYFTLADGRVIRVSDHPPRRSVTVWFGPKDTLQTVQHWLETNLKQQR